MKVLCIGHSAYDITIPIQHFPKENKKYPVDEMIECGGGPAGNAAYLISKWGMSCGYAGVLGTDIYGMKIKEEYLNEGVDLRYLVFDENNRTPVSYILANSENGSRTLFTYKKRSFLSKIEFGEDDPNTILVDGFELDAAIEAIKKYPKATSILDGGSYNSSTKKLAEMVDYLVCSEDFARDFSGISHFNSQENREQLFQKLEELNPNKIVVTLGEKGSLYKQGGTLLHQNAYQVEAVDTTGAGDIFHGAFAYGITNGYDITKTIKIASIAAALSVQKLGGRVSIPPLEEVIELYSKDVI